MLKAQIIPWCESQETAAGSSSSLTIFKTENSKGTSPPLAFCALDYCAEDLFLAWTWEKEGKNYMFLKCSLWAMVDATISV